MIKMLRSRNINHALLNKCILKHQRGVLNSHKNCNGFLLKLLLKSTVLKEISFPSHCHCSNGKYKNVSKVLQEIAENPLLDFRGDPLSVPVEGCLANIYKFIIGSIGQLLFQLYLCNVFFYLSVEIIWKCKPVKKIYFSFIISL